MAAAAIRHPALLIAAMVHTPIRGPRAEAVAFHLIEESTRAYESHFGRRLPPSNLAASYAPEWSDFL